MAEEVQGLGRLLRRLAELKTDTSHVEKPLKAAGAYMLGSIEKNFRAQGRPEKWEGLADSTRKRRRKGRGRGGPQILIDTAGFKNSFSFRVVAAGVEIGTNKVFARRHHFGYPGGSGRGQAKTPARPMLLFQDEDVREIGEIFKRHVEKK
jgi:phage virion morphogenesis protein